MDKTASLATDAKEQRIDLSLVDLKPLTASGDKQQLPSVVSGLEKDDGREFQWQPTTGGRTELPGMEFPWEHKDPALPSTLQDPAQSEKEADPEPSHIVRLLNRSPWHAHSQGHLHFTDIPAMGASAAVMQRMILPGMEMMSLPTLVGVAGMSIDGFKFLTARDSFNKNKYGACLAADAVASASWIALGMRAGTPLKIAKALFYGACATRAVMPFIPDNVEPWAEK